MLQWLTALLAATSTWSNHYMQTAVSSITSVSLPEVLTPATPANQVNGATFYSDNAFLNHISNTKAPTSWNQEDSTPNFPPPVLADFDFTWPSPLLVVPTQYLQSSYYHRLSFVTSCNNGLPEFDCGDRKIPTFITFFEYILQHPPDYGQLFRALFFGGIYLTGKLKGRDINGHYKRSIFDCWKGFGRAWYLLLSVSSSLFFGPPDTWQFFAVEDFWILIWLLDWTRKPKVPHQQPRLRLRERRLAIEFTPRKRICWYHGTSGRPVQSFSTERRFFHLYTPVQQPVMDVEFLKFQVRLRQALRKAYCDGSSIRGPWCLASIPDDQHKSNTDSPLSEAVVPAATTSQTLLAFSDGEYEADCIEIAEGPTSQTPHSMSPPSGFFFEVSADDAPHIAKTQSALSTTPNNTKSEQQRSDARNQIDTSSIPDAGSTVSQALDTSTSPALLSPATEFEHISSPAESSSPSSPASEAFSTPTSKVSPSTPLSSPEPSASPSTPSRPPKLSLSSFAPLGSRSSMRKRRARMSTSCLEDTQTSDFSVDDFDQFKTEWCAASSAASRRHKTKTAKNENSRAVLPTTTKEEERVATEKLAEAQEGAIEAPAEAQPISESNRAIQTKASANARVAQREADSQRAAAEMAAIEAERSLKQEEDHMATLAATMAAARAEQHHLPAIWEPVERVPPAAEIASEVPSEEAAIATAEQAAEKEVTATEAVDELIVAGLTLPETQPEGFVSASSLRKMAQPGCGFSEEVLEEPLGQSESVESVSGLVNNEPEAASVPLASETNFRSCQNNLDHLFSEEEALHREVEPAATFESQTGTGAADTTALVQPPPAVVEAGVESNLEEAVPSSSAIQTTLAELSLVLEATASYQEQTGFQDDGTQPSASIDQSEDHMDLDENPDPRLNLEDTHGYLAEYREDYAEVVRGFSPDPILPAGLAQEREVVARLQNNTVSQALDEGFVSEMAELSINSTPEPLHKGFVSAMAKLSISNSPEIMIGCLISAMVKLSISDAISGLVDTLTGSSGQKFTEPARDEERISAASEAAPSESAPSPPPAIPGTEDGSLANSPDQSAASSFSTDGSEISIPSTGGPDASMTEGDRSNRSISLAEEAVALSAPADQETSFTASAEQALNLTVPIEQSTSPTDQALTLTTSAEQNASDLATSVDESSISTQDVEQTSAIEAGAEHQAHASVLEANPIVPTRTPSRIPKRKIAKPVSQLRKYRTSSSIVTTQRTAPGAQIDTSASPLSLDESNLNSLADAAFTAPSQSLHQSASTIDTSRFDLFVNTASSLLPLPLPQVNSKLESQDVSWPANIDPQLADPIPSQPQTPDAAAPRERDDDTNSELSELQGEVDDENQTFKLWIPSSTVEASSSRSEMAAPDTASDHTPDTFEPRDYSGPTVDPAIYLEDSEPEDDEPQVSAPVQSPQVSTPQPQVEVQAQEQPQQLTLELELPQQQVMYAQETAQPQLYAQQTAQTQLYAHAEAPAVGLSQYASLYRQPGLTLSADAQSSPCM